MIEKQAQNAAMGISANIITASDPVAIALMSIAISLKRIADILEVDTGLKDGIITAEQASELWKRG